jgi:hypothetical protein
MKQLLIAALKSKNGPETLDFWLTQYDRPLAPLPSALHLQAHFAKL